MIFVSPSNKKIAPTTLAARAIHRVWGETLRFLANANIAPTNITMPPAKTSYTFPMVSNTHCQAAVFDQCSRCARPSTASDAPISNSQVRPCHAGTCIRPLRPTVNRSPTIARMIRNTPSISGTIHPSLSIPYRRAQLAADENVTDQPPPTAPPTPELPTPTPPPTSP
jgi:hypothetical protein